MAFGGPFKRSRIELLGNVHVADRDDCTRGVACRSLPALEASSVMRDEFIPDMNAHLALMILRSYISECDYRLPNGVCGICVRSTGQMLIVLWI